MKQAQLAKIELCKLKAFENHPYKVQDDAEMDALTESIRENGVLAPLLVRPLNNRMGEYEIVSGHRRMRAAERAGLSVVPAFVSELDRADAVIMMVDSNLHREHLLPSEKAFAYKLKLEAMKQQGKRTDLTSGQVGPKLTADTISEQDSGSQVKRYIRLTWLLPELLKLVDEGKIALTPAVYLSYLSAEQQRWVLEGMKRSDCIPSVSQAHRLKKECQAGTLTPEAVATIMGKESATQRENLKIPMERVRRFFPASYTAAQIEEEIVKLCETRYRTTTAMQQQII